MKIATELYLRTMSPKQFHAEFGGGSVSRVDYHFKKLAEYDWLELVQTKSGGTRRSATEHFYRATDLVIFDLERWSELPASIRSSFSLMTFEQLTERAVSAIEAGTFDARPDRHLSWTPVRLDRVGWERIIGALDELFEMLVPEQSDAKLRVAKSEETPALVTVALAGFEAATSFAPPAFPFTRPKACLPGTSPVKTASDARLLFPAHLAKVFADPLALQMIAEANLREISASQFRDEFGGGTASDLDRRLKRLAKAGWLEVSAVRSGGRRRGAKEYFYRAIGPAILDHKSWSEVPEEVRETITWKTFEQLREKVLDAIEAGTFDAHPDRHLTWALLRLDQEGWSRVRGAVDAFFQSLFREEREAQLRMTETDEEPIPTLVALMAFESPAHGPRAH